MSSLNHHRLMKSAAIALIALAGGCNQGNKTAQAPQVAPTPEVIWREQPIVMPPQVIKPVAEGAPPLVFMVESAALVRIVDMTTNEDLLSIPVQNRTIVAVNQKTGVQVGGSTWKPGPLPADHRYGIYIGSNEANVIRSGLIRPGQPGQQQIIVPASQPTGGQP